MTTKIRGVRMPTPLKKSSARYPRWDVVQSSLLSLSQSVDEEWTLLLYHHSLLVAHSISGALSSFSSPFIVKLLSEFTIVQL